MSKKAKKISTHLVVALGASLALGGIFTVLSMQSFAKVNILVAAKDLEPYSAAITAEDFKTIQIAKGDIGNFNEFVINANDLIGKVPATPIFSGQPVKEIQFINPDDAKGLQSIVTDEGNRGLYLPMTAANALLGDMKMGGEYDFYIVTEKPKPTETSPENTETIVVPLQSSFMVNKIITSESGEVNVFFEFPEDESEKYVMLKNLLIANKASLIATMPNAIHEEYKSNRLDFTTFFSGLMSSNEFFTSVNDKNNSDGNTPEIIVEGDEKTNNKDGNSAN